MKITLGYWLDDAPIEFGKASLGEVSVGPMGLLALLEARLGLTGDHPGNAVRVAQYQAALTEANDGECFYSRSFARDPLAVAETLLAWRDDLVAGGWCGGAPLNGGARLADLAEVERCSAGRLDPGISDRLRRVIEALEERRHGIDTVRLMEPLEVLPPAVRTLLGRLPTDEHTVDAPTGSSDLAALQAALVNGVRFTPKADGSVVVLAAREEGVLGPALAQLLQAHEPTGWWPLLDTAVITGQRGEVLDAALIAMDAPAIGDTSRSPWRSPLQVLRLVLAQLWTPIDPFRLLQLLTHPTSPLPRRLASRLADAVASAPGVGGTPWLEAIEAAIADEPDKEETLREAVSVWLDPPRVSPEEGAALDLVAEQAGRVMRWAGALSERQDTSAAAVGLFRKASSQAGEFLQMIEALRAAGETRIVRLQLERLLDRICGAGSAQADQVAEVGAVACAAAPGALVNAVDRIVWWDFSAPGHPPLPPWTEAECSALGALGIELESYEKTLEREALGWDRGVLTARQQLVLVMPQRSRGEPLEHHPLWERLDALVNGALPVIDIDVALAEGVCAQLPLRLEAMPTEPLPTPKRWWTVTGVEITPRETESFSSLSTFINAPFEWVLRYKALLYPGRLVSLSEGPQLKGNLAHRLIEWLFAESGPNWRKMDKSALSHWVASQFETLLTREGATLLLPGQGAEREALAETLGAAMLGLVTGLKAAKVVHVAVERTVAGRFAGGALEGRVDLLVRKDSGRSAVVDIKWSGGKYRRGELQENRHLQLALYGELVRQAERRWPDVAYFVVDQARFYAPSNAFFPTAFEVPPPDGENIGSLWKAFEVAWRWRRSQIDAGRIEVPVPGTDPDEASMPPEGAFSPAEKRWTNAYDLLAGWEEEA